MSMVTVPRSKTMARAPVLELSSVSFSYSLDSGESLPIIADLSLTIAAGEFTVLVGPSGCGKTSLLKLIAGLLKPQHGRIEIESPEETGDKVAYVFQEPALLPWRSIYDNLNLVHELTGQPISPFAIIDKIDAVGLSGFANAFPDELSGGMRSRAALARALMANPSLLLLDEPFGALDELTAESLCTQLHDLWTKSGLTIMLVTHNLEHAVLLGTRVLVSTPRPLSIIEDICLAPAEKTSDFMRSPLFVDQLMQLRSAFRNGLELRRKRRPS